MKNRSDAISIRISSEAKAELRRIAEEERRTVSQLVAIVIERYLAERKASDNSAEPGKDRARKPKS